MSRFLSLLCVAVALCASAACQAAPQTVAQGAGAPQSAPVSQERSVIVNLSLINGSGAISGEHRTGPDASGDVKAAESQRSGAQTSTPTQTVSVDPAAVAKAATDLLATVSPTGQAATLANLAVAEAKAGSPSKSKELLDAATAAAAAELKAAAAPRATPAK